MQTDLYDRTLELLRKRPHDLTYAEIERKTGIKQSWIRMFASGIKEPSVNKINTLYNFLSDKPLKVK